MLLHCKTCIPLTLIIAEPSTCWLFDKSLTCQVILYNFRRWVLLVVIVGKIKKDLPPNSTQGSRIEQDPPCRQEFRIPDHCTWDCYSKEWSDVHIFVLILELPVLDWTDFDVERTWAQLVLHVIRMMSTSNRVRSYQWSHQISLHCQYRFLEQWTC